MKRHIRYYRMFWLRHDLPAGLSVFLVALPLCLGIALASGVPLYAGILSGVIGGVVVSLISGSPLAVSGPAAGLTTVVAGAIVILGSYETFLLAVIIAGIFQLLLGVFKLGTIANYFPRKVRGYGRRHRLLLQRPMFPTGGRKEVLLTTCFPYYPSAKRRIILSQHRSIGSV